MDTPFLNRLLKLTGILGLMLVPLFALSMCNNNPPTGKIVSFIYPTVFLKFVDQDNNPIEGVEVEVSHGRNSWIYSNSGRGRYNSNQDGILKVKKDTRVMRFQTAAKESYVIRLNEQLFQRDLLLDRSNSYSHIMASDLAKNSEDSPLTIHGWRVDQVEEKSKCLNDQGSFAMNTDGRKYSLEKSNIDTFENQILENIVVTFNRSYITKDWRDIYKDSYRTAGLLKGDWEYVVEVLNGGLIEIDANDRYMKAPVDNGYLKKWVLNKENFRALRRYGRGSNDEDERHFYIKIGDSLYGRLSLNFEPKGSSRAEFQNGLLGINYSINLDGNRLVRGFNSRFNGVYKDNVSQSSINKKAQSVIPSIENGDEQLALVLGGFVTNETSGQRKINTSCVDDWLVHKE